jgi:hypothetical protein
MPEILQKKGDTAPIFLHLLPLPQIELRFSNCLVNLFQMNLVSDAVVTYVFAYSRLDFSPHPTLDKYDSEISKQQGHGLPIIPQAEGYK